MTKLNVALVPVSPIEQNSRLLWAEESKEAVVIDPGADAERLFEALETLALTPVAIWLTHSHLDHAGGVAPFLKKYAVPLFAHPNEAEFRGHVEDSAARFGIAPGIFLNSPEPSDPIVGGETLWIGGLEFKVLFTPGHSPGHLAFFQPENKILIAGDALFKGSIGRTDLPGGDHELLLRSIHEQIFTLPGETQVLSGHGPDTTVEAERMTNPFV